MARVPKAYIQKLAERLAPGAERAFTRWVLSVRSRTALDEIERAIQGPSLAGFEAKLKADFEASGFARQITKATIAGGEATAPLVPAALAGGNQMLRISFGIQNPYAIRATRESAQRVTEIGKSVMEAIRAEIRDGVRAGLGPRAIARQVRPLIGLTTGQKEWVKSARSRLASTDPDDLRAYLRMRLRDKRFDGHVYTALRTGSPIPMDKAVKMGNRYAERALKYRSEVIARTETLEALQAGQRALWDKAMGEGFVAPDMLVKQWVDGGDARVRESHRNVEGGAWIPMSQDFVLSSDVSAREPRDPSLPKEETIQCRCTMIIRVDPNAPARRVDPAAVS